MRQWIGGTVALAFALGRQHRIRKLLLADVAAAFPEQGKAAFRFMVEKVAREGMDSIAPIAAARVYHSDYLKRNQRSSKSGGASSPRSILRHLWPPASC